MLGTKSLSNLPVAVIVSVVASPKSTSPPATNVVNVPAAAVLAPIVVPSIAPLSIFTSVSYTHLRAHET